MTSGSTTVSDPRRVGLFGARSRSLFLSASRRIFIRNPSILSLLFGASLIDFTKSSRSPSEMSVMN